MCAPPQSLTRSLVLGGLLGALIWPLGAGCALSARGAVQAADRQWRAPARGIRERAAEDMGCEAAKLRVFRVRRLRRSAQDVKWAYNLFHVAGCGKARNYLQGCTSRGCGWTLSPEMAFCLKRRCPLPEVRLSYLERGHFLVQGCGQQQVYLLYQGVWVTREREE